VGTAFIGICSPPEVNEAIREHCDDAHAPMPAHGQQSVRARVGNIGPPPLRKNAEGIAVDGTAGRIDIGFESNEIRHPRDLAAPVTLGFGRQ
jgi:hypothetical protein